MDIQEHRKSSTDERSPLLAEEPVAVVTIDACGGGAPAEPRDACDAAQQDNESDAGAPDPVAVGLKECLTEDERRRRRRYMIVSGVALFASGVSSASLIVAGQLPCRVRDPHFLAESGCDAAIGCVAFAVLAGLLLLMTILRHRRPLVGGKLPCTVLIHHVTIVAWIAGTGKLWVYRWQQAHRASVLETFFNDLPVALMVLVPPLVMWLNELMHRIDFPPTLRLKASSVRQILTPYFIPDGFLNKIIVAGTWLLMFGGKACGVISPIFISRAVDQMSATPPQNPVVNIVIFGALALVPRVTEEIQDMIVSNVWRIAYIQVADRTFRHVHTLSLEWHLKKKMGHVIRYMDRGMNAAQQLVSYVIMYIGPAIAVAVTSFVIFATEFAQPEIAAVCFIFMSMYIWLTIVVTVWRKIFFTEMNVHDNDLHDKATDSLINFETVKYFTNEEYEAARYKSSVVEYQRNQRNSLVSVAVLNMTQATIMEGCRAVALVIAGWCVINNSDGFNVGQFVAVSTYLTMLFTPFQFLGTVYETAVQSLVDMQNLSDLLAEDPDLIDAPDAVDLLVERQENDAQRHVPVSVEFRNVRFWYPTQGPSSGIRNISFFVAPGTTTAIVGTTGSGKTTLTRLLFRFYDTLDGQILVHGKDVKKLTQKSLRQHIGIVPQDTVLFNDTIRYNIAYGRPGATESEITAAARAAQLLPFIERLDHGWDTFVGERGLKLSGGEKQRVAIARCLLKDPSIVVLDEATSALDNKTEKEVQQALGSLSGRTTIVVAHRLSTIQHADQILVMQQGAIVERGTFAELMSDRSGEFFSMWQAQLRSATATINEGDPPKGGE